jgi:hypothetical protein
VVHTDGHGSGNDCCLVQAQDGEPPVDVRLDVWCGRGCPLSNEDRYGSQYEGTVPAEARGLQLDSLLD